MKHGLWSLVFCLACQGLCGCGAGNTAAAPLTEGVPDGYSDLCGATGVSCQSGATPLNMVGTYTGTGTTVVTTNELWAVGNSQTFRAVIASQTGETGAGTFDLGDFHLDIAQANFRGTLTQFTIFGTNSVAQNESDASVPSTCSFEARAVITGTQSTTGTTTTVTGQTILAFTKNILGPGCTQDQINNYPGTGATFNFTATRTP